MSAIKIKKFFRKQAEGQVWMEKLHVAFDRESLECLHLLHNTGHFTWSASLKVQRMEAGREAGRGSGFKPVRTEKVGLMTIDAREQNGYCADKDSRLPGSSSEAYGCTLEDFDSGCLWEHGLVMGRHLMIIKKLTKWDMILLEEVKEQYQWNRTIRYSIVPSPPKIVDGWSPFGSSTVGRLGGSEVMRLTGGLADVRRGGGVGAGGPKEVDGEGLMGVWILEWCAEELEGEDMGERRVVMVGCGGSGRGVGSSVGEAHGGAVRRKVLVGVNSGSSFDKLMGFSKVFGWYNLHNGINMRAKVMVLKWPIRGTKSGYERGVSVTKQSKRGSSKLKACHPPPMETKCLNKRLSAKLLMCGSYLDRKYLNSVVGKFLVKDYLSSWACTETGTLICRHSTTDSLIIEVFIHKNTIHIEALRRTYICQRSLHCLVSLSVDKVSIPHKYVISQSGLPLGHSQLLLATQYCDKTNPSGFLVLKPLSDAPFVAGYQDIVQISSERSKLKRYALTHIHHYLVISIQAVFGCLQLLRTLEMAIFKQLIATIDSINIRSMKSSVKRSRKIQLADASGFHCQAQQSAAPTPSQLVPTPTPSHVQIPTPPITSTPPSTQSPPLTQPVQSTTPPLQPSSVQLTSSPPPIQPVETTSSPPMFTIPDTQPTPPPSPQVPSPSYHDTEGPSFEPSYHMSPPPSHEPEIQTSRTSEESEQLRNLLDLVPRLESRVESLEKELSDTKQTLGTAVLQLIKKVKKLKNKLRHKRQREETEDKEDAEGQDQDIPSPTDQGNKFATPEKSKDSGEAQAEQISPSTLEAAQILTNVASEGFKGSQAPPGSKIYRRKPKSTTTPTKVLDFEEPAERPVNTGSTPSAQVNTGSTPSAQVNTGSTPSAKLMLLRLILVKLMLLKLILVRQKGAREEAAREALATEFDYIQARLNADQILAEKIQQEKYERYKKQDQTFVAIGTEEDERAIKKMNEKATHKEEEKKDESVHEEVKEEEGAKKRKLGTRRKLKAKRRKHASGLTREEDDLKICLHIAPDEDKVIDVESLDHQYPIVEWQSFFLTTKPQYDQSKPDEDIYLNKVTRSNGHQRFFRTLMGVLSILDREDLKIIYELVMEEYKDKLPEGFDRMLWGDLMIMFNQGDTADFWDTQQDWNLISWKLHSSSGVHTIMTSTGLVFHMLVESRYPLTKEVLSQMLELKLETEEESSMALELIKFVKQQLEEFEDSNDDDLVTSDHGEEERV
ncbi:hypothetical protein Tco_0991135 [Tanacetum coccineum]|uniref:Uncharacterized protein n=1 Tax=Tanacetum coccineum TaxID=301880 RepID=A0ABQ5EYE6_9ASTR